MSRDGNDHLLIFVALQAAKRLPDISPKERLVLMSGLRLILPLAEMEQCEIAFRAIAEMERAKVLAEASQMVLSDLLETL